MQEIEFDKKFEIWANRDIYILDNAHKKKNEFTPEESVRKVMLERVGVLTKFKAYSKKSIKGLRDDLTNKIPLAWVFLVIVELVISYFVINPLLENNVRRLLEIPNLIPLVLIAIGFLTIFILAISKSNLK